MYCIEWTYYQEYFGFWYYLKPGGFALTGKVHSIVVRKMMISNSHIKINIFLKKKMLSSVQKWDSKDGIKSNMLIYSEKRSF